MSSLSSSTAHAKIRGDLADFITDHPTTNGDPVNAIVQPDKPPTFKWPAHWSPREEDLGGHPANVPGPAGSSQLAKVREDAQQEKVEQQKANTVSAANAEAIAVQVLATKLQSPIHVHEAGKTTTFEPLGKTPKGPGEPGAALVRHQAARRAVYLSHRAARIGRLRQANSARSDVVDTLRQREEPPLQRWCRGAGSKDATRQRFRIELSPKPNGTRGVAV